MKNASRFRQNQETVKSPDGMRLFTPGNYLFSTKAEGREETLYFRNHATKQTGRLRQQHGDGRLAKIDKVPKTHLFLSEKRYKYLKRWYEHERKKSRKLRRIPKIRRHERRRTEGKYHIEFSCKGKRLLKWHRSRERGRVKIRKNPKRLVRDALNKVCGK
jgi:hypothetical protein